MALFESKESKEQKKQMKRDEEAAAQRAKQMAKLAQYHLDSVDNEYTESLIEAVNNLAGTGLMDIGRIMSGSKAEDSIKIAFLHTIMDQNWVMIRQLDQLNKNIQTLIKSRTE